MTHNTCPSGWHPVARCNTVPVEDAQTPASDATRPPDATETPDDTRARVETAEGRTEAHSERLRDSIARLEAVDLWAEAARETGAGGMDNQGAELERLRAEVARLRAHSPEDLAQKAYAWSASNGMAPLHALNLFRAAAGLGEAKEERLRAEAAERALADERAKVAQLTRLLGSHADGHRCTCTMTDPGNYYVEGGNAHPPEWEQDPWCPTHPDVEQIRAALLALADDWDGKADDGEERGHAAAARAVRLDAAELRALAAPEDGA